MNKALYSIVKIIVKPIIGCLIKDVKGVENFPEESFIIAANHTSYLDPLVIFYIIPIYHYYLVLPRIHSHISNH